MRRAFTSTRLGYAASDVGGQFLFCWVMWYGPYFYTDVCQFPAAAVGTLLLIVRWLDAVDAPLWGVVFDRTHSPLGKSRPWFLWLSAPFATFGVLTFLSPRWNENARIAYAALTYVGCNVLFTGINTPVTAILSALTVDRKERVTLTTFRMLGSKLGVLAVHLSAMKLVRTLGQGDDRRGFMFAVFPFAIASIALFVVAFRNLNEAVPVQTKPPRLRHTFRALEGNWPWLIVATSNLFFWTGFIARITAAPYYLKYVLHRPDLVGYANGLDFASLATALLLPWLCRRTSKRNLWALGLAGMVFAQVLLWLGAGRGHAFGVMAAAWALGFVFSGAAMTMPFTMLSDTVDYGEWKTKIRAAGLLSALGTGFCVKASAGLGAGLCMWILGAGGYVPNQEQTPMAIRAIERAIVWVPAVSFTLALLPLIFYGPFERLESQIHVALDQRRFASSPTARANLPL